MKTVGELMTRDVVWVNPSAPVKSAVILMKGHRISALPVLDADGSVVGLVTESLLLGESPDKVVGEVMTRNFAAVDSATTINDAAEQMTRAGASHILVLDGNRLAGIISRSDLIPELGKTFDPLTNLPWSNSLREWAVAALKRGSEIAVIFFDLDNYGKFNKEHGHVIGDRVIQEVAEVIRRGIDPDLDFACRYAGDEFAIVSLRRADEARALAGILQERIAAIKVEGIADGISATFGMSGGRRTREREDIHYAATIDDLITRASKDCIARKPKRVPIEVPTGPSEVAPRPYRAPRLRIKSISITTTGTEASVAVRLVSEDREYVSDVSARATGGRDVLRLVAEATADAASKSLAEEHGIVVDELHTQHTETEYEVITVVATFVSPKGTIQHAGSAIARRGDLHRAVASATLDAVNRLIETAPRS
ncbi:MAG: GGDEF domain-containing protein [Armatimonadetes bacterium]|nr:GGDEF domain-containing protein [Armatimonadota bacterium]